MKKLSEDIFTKFLPKNKNTVNKFFCKKGKRTTTDQFEAVLEKRKFKTLI